ncbi:MAG: DUF4242 domain-containing protein [Nitrospinota bacterium]|nr:DUF4242 domain-containing protein [Nitrospinota bacterium]MDH5757611.1 DUF4242 domain-containing protein [Nitrospinota bacterium]
MPIFMDRHFIKGVTKHMMDMAHEQDIEIQGRHGVQILTYWFDEKRSTAFCLMDSPDKDTISKYHSESHGNIPHEIIEVDPSTVEMFLGRIKDPVPSPGSDKSTEVQVDSAFRTIMFTDLVDSTKMTLSVGDEKAMHYIRVHNAMSREAIRSFDGREIKHTGDGLMVSFVHSGKGVKCAVAIQNAFREYNQTHPEEELRVRIGMSAGEPVQEDEDLFGAVVVQAARLCATAQPESILVSEAVREGCGEEFSFHDVGSFDLKGFSAPVNAYQVKY